MLFFFRVILIIYFQFDKVFSVVVLFKVLFFIAAIGQLFYGEIESEGLRRIFVFFICDYGGLMVWGKCIEFIFKFVFRDLVFCFRVFFKFVFFSINQEDNEFSVKVQELNFQLYIGNEKFVCQLRYFFFFQEQRM